MPEPTVPLSGASRGAPAARRVAVPSWRDPRLAVGVLLVLAAVVAGSRVVAAADRTVPVYAAAQVLTPGDPVGADDLDVVRVRVDGGAGAGAYVAADEESQERLGGGPGQGEGLVALRGVGAGELVPAAALGRADAVDVRPVGVPVTGALPEGLVPGALVDLWVTAVDPTTPGARLDPRLVVASAPVAEVDDDAGGLGTAAATTVQVLVGSGELPDVLAALAADARVALVVSPGGEQAGQPAGGRADGDEGGLAPASDGATPAPRTPTSPTRSSADLPPTSASPSGVSGAQGGTTPVPTDGSTEGAPPAAEASASPEGEDAGG